MVGEDGRADELLARIADQVVAAPWADARIGLIETAIDLGHPERGDALAARLIAKNAEAAEEVLQVLYGKQSQQAAMLWEASRAESPKKELQATLRSLRRMLTAKPDAAMLADLRKLAPWALRLPIAAAGSSMEERLQRRARRLLALAALFHRCGDDAKALLYLRKTSPLGLDPHVLVEQGNFLAELKEWNAALPAYRAAWNKDPRSAAALYLDGWTQAKLGVKTNGRENKDAALEVPLGEGEVRLDLIRTLLRLHEKRRGGPAAASSAADGRFRRSRLGANAVGNRRGRPASGCTADRRRRRACRRRPAGRAPRHSHRLRRQCCGEEHRHDCQRGPGYARCPLLRQHVLYAPSRPGVALLQKAKTAEAIDELHQAEALMPVNVELAIDCDALLRKQGAAAEADALYRRMAGRLQADCRDFERSAGCRNDLAWLAANLNRDLDMALANAQRAVELAPQSAGILDTLAEVEYRRGSRTEAMRLARRVSSWTAAGRFTGSGWHSLPSKPMPQRNGGPNPSCRTNQCIEWNSCYPRHQCHPRLTVLPSRLSRKNLPQILRVGRVIDDQAVRLRRLQLQPAAIPGVVDCAADLAEVDAALAEHVGAVFGVELADQLAQRTDLLGHVATLVGGVAHVVIDLHVRQARAVDDLAVVVGAEIVFQADDHAQLFGLRQQARGGL